MARGPFTVFAWGGGGAQLSVSTPEFGLVAVSGKPHNEEINLKAPMGPPPVPQ